MKGQSEKSGAPRISGQAFELNHELGNVLNGLLGMTRLLCDCATDSRQALWLGAVEQSARQLQRLIRRAVRPRERSFEPRIVVLDGIDLLEQVVLRHSPASARQGNRLILTVHPVLPRPWRSDPGLLQQLLDNLLSNAIKYTRDGEVHVIARPAGEAGGLLIEVRDTGPGVTPGCERQIFVAGDRGDQAVADQAAGYGLGLYICRRIVTELGGELDCFSAAGEGAVFQLLLPGLFESSEHPSLMPTSRLLQRLDCELHLEQPLHGSVAAWLQRFGISRHPGASDRKRAASKALRVSIRELPPTDAAPGPHLSLDLQAADGMTRESVYLSGPIVGSSLVPALLRFTLRRRLSG